jgi:hypothetical protein
VAGGNNVRVPNSSGDVVAALEELIEAYHVLRDRLMVNEAILAEALEQIKGGAGVGETLRTVRSLQERRAAEEAVLWLYDARHKLRQAVIRAAVAEGMDVGELAKAYGLPLDTVISYASEMPTEH